MTGMLKISGPPISDFEMEKILKILKRNIEVSGFEGNDSQKDTLICETAVFQFVKQILVERPAYLHCVIDGLLHSHIMTGKYLKHHNFINAENERGDLEVLCGYIIDCGNTYNQTITVPEGTLLN